MPCRWFSGRDRDTGFVGGKRHFDGAVHLGLYDVDRALARVADTVLLGPLDILNGDSAGDHGV